MPLRPSLRGKGTAAPTSERRPWTKAACPTHYPHGRESAEIFAATDRRKNGSDVIAFRCPYGDHYHVAAPPLACKACGGTGQNSRGTDECVPCRGTGVKT